MPGSISTVMVILIGILYLMGGIGLTIEPGSSEWWLSRPVWITVLILLLLPAALMLSPLERISHNPQKSAPSPFRQISGAIILCLGIAMLAMFGFGGGIFPGQDFVSFLLVISGAGIGGLLPGFKTSGSMQK